MYAAEEDLRMDTNEVRLSVVDMLNSELSSHHVDVDPFAAKKEKMKIAELSKYWEKVKLKFTLALQEDEEYAEPATTDQGRGDFRLAKEVSKSIRSPLIEKTERVVSFIMHPHYSLLGL